MKLEVCTGVVCLSLALSGAHTAEALSTGGGHPEHHARVALAGPAWSSPIIAGATLSRHVSTPAPEATRVERFVFYVGKDAGPQA